MPQPDKVQSSEEGKTRLRKVLQEKKLTEKLTQDEVAKQAHVSLDTLKRLLGTKECPNGVERWAVTNLANFLNIKPTDIVDPKDWNPQQQLPPEFEPLIKEKIKSFCGRKFVFDAFEQFIKNNDRGYFTVVGYAGMGKSAIAAKYVSENLSLCYFISRNERDQYKKFLKCIRQQLNSRYQLQNTEEDDDLRTLLAKVSQKLTSSQPLVIVIDSLDEVNQKLNPGQNALSLPTTLPERVYFFLTRQPYDPRQDPLLHISTIPRVQVNLINSQPSNCEDIKQYIFSCNDDDCFYKKKLLCWLNKYNINFEYFASKLSSDSENNFNYVHHFLSAIAAGTYEDPNLDTLPDTLQKDYQLYWEIMKMQNQDIELEARQQILYTLVRQREGISIEKMAEIIPDKEDCDIEDILKDWTGYLIEENEIQGQTCYRLYHQGFVNFIKSKRAMRSNRYLFQKINYYLNQ